jgi:hypothetical protein
MIGYVLNGKSTGAEAPFIFPLFAALKRRSSTVRRDFGELFYGRTRASAAP